MENITKALLVMDGNYVRKWYSHLAEDGFEGRYYSINFNALTDYLSTVIEKDFGTRCVFSAKRLYIGTNSEVDSRNLNFYRSLDDAGIQKNTFPLRIRDEEGRAALKEEACDTTIVFDTAKDFYSTTRENRFDTLVLFAGDGDLTPLVLGLKAEGVKCVVVYYDFKTPYGNTRASQKLLESADKVVNFGSFLTERVDRKIISIFTPIESAPDTRDSFLPSVLVGIYSLSEVKKAVMEMPKRDADGWVLVGPLGKYLEKTTHKVLPPGVKLKEILNHFDSVFETKDTPAYSVRIKD